MEEQHYAFFSFPFGMRRSLYSSKFFNGADLVCRAGVPDKPPLSHGTRRRGTLFASFNSNVTICPSDFQCSVQVHKCQLIQNLIPEGQAWTALSAESAAWHRWSRVRFVRVVILFSRQEYL